MSTETLSRNAEQSDALLAELCLAVSHDLTLLASLHDKELSPNKAAEIKAVHFPRSLGINLDDAKADSVITMLAEEIQNWPSDFPRSVEQDLAADYASIYLNNYCNASPQESVWIDEDHLAWQEPMFQVRRVYEKFGLGVDNWRVRADDHLVTELQFIAWLLSQENPVQHFELIEKFMDEHLLRWVTPFGERVAQRCGTPFYAGLGLLTGLYCNAFRDLLAEITNRPRPSEEEILERTTPEKIEAVPVKFVPGAEASW